jgi:outer membrane murein-binding lipoprotein Lpp
MSAAAGLAAAGCGSTNPPCPVDMSEVDQARSEARTVEARMETLQEQRDRLEGDVADAKRERESLQARKADLETQIDQMMGGQ